MRHPKEAENYINRLFAREDEVLQNAALSLKGKFPQLYPIQLGAGEGKILQLLVRLAGVKRAIEVGSLAGYSALWTAEALPEDGELYAINRDPAHHRLLQDNIARREEGAAIIPHLGEGKAVLETLAAQAPFDMIFIDADKPGYPAYLDWAEQYIRKGGLIIGDNTLLFGHVWKENPPEGKGAPSAAAWRAMREFNERLADPSRYLSVLLPTQEGMTVAIKQF